MAVGEAFSSVSVWFIVNMNYQWYVSYNNVKTIQSCRAASPDPSSCIVRRNCNRYRILIDLIDNHFLGHGYSLVPSAMSSSLGLLRPLGKHVKESDVLGSGHLLAPIVDSLNVGSDII